MKLEKKLHQKIQSLLMKRGGYEVLYGNTHIVDVSEIAVDDCHKVDVHYRIYHNKESVVDCIKSYIGEDEWIYMYLVDSEGKGLTIKDAESLVDAMQGEAVQYHHPEYKEKYEELAKVWRYKTDEI